jgi:hypothetical protein
MLHIIITVSCDCKYADIWGLSAASFDEMAYAQILNNIETKQSEDE